VAIFCLLLKTDRVWSASFFLLEGNLRVVLYHHFSFIIDFGMSFRSQTWLRNLFSTHLLSSFLLIRLRIQVISFHRHIVMFVTNLALRRY